MNLHIYNSTEKELSEKKNPVFIGISVGIKPMSFDIATSYLNWAEKHSSTTVQILIADEIAKYNYLAFSHSTKPGALSRAIRDGDQYYGFFEKTISNLGKSGKFNIIRWNDIQNNYFSNTLKEVQVEFETNPIFKDDIVSILNKYIKRRKKPVSEEKKILLCQYLLEELPTLLDGIYVGDTNYSLILYPTYNQSGMSGLVSDIQNKRKHVGLSERLNLKKTIMVEALIEETPGTLIAT